ncbi:MAG: hypothetical protein OXF64_03190, partial [bacterium]|nr:hypothetical protein [bacterium]
GVSPASGEYVRGVKAYAARPGDIADIEMLMTEQNMDSSDLLPLVIKAYGADRAQDRENAIALVVEAINQNQDNTPHRRGPQPDVA